MKKPEGKKEEEELPKERKKKQSSKLRCRGYQITSRNSPRTKIFNKILLPRIVQSIKKGCEIAS